MKAMRFLLKVSGVVLMVLGAACLIAGYADRIKALFCEKKRPAEFDDYAD